MKLPLTYELCPDKVGKGVYQAHRLYRVRLRVFRVRLFNLPRRGLELPRLSRLEGLLTRDFTERG